jgi:hypothetical protein
VYFIILKLCNFLFIFNTIVQCWGSLISSAPIVHVISPLKTPFGLLIRLLQSHTYNHLFRCVTFTQLTILHAKIPFPHSLHNTLQIKPSLRNSPRIHFLSLSPTENSSCLSPAENCPRLAPAENSKLLSQSQSQSHIATDGQSVSKSWCRAPSGAYDQIFITVWQLRSCFFFVERPLWGEDGSVFCQSHCVH